MVLLSWLHERSLRFCQTNLSIHQFPFRGSRTGCSVITLSGVRRPAPIARACLLGNRGDDVRMIRGQYVDGAIGFGRCRLPGGWGSTRRRTGRIATSPGRKGREAKMETSSSESGQNSRPYARIPGSADGRRARQDFACEHCGRTSPPSRSTTGAGCRRAGSAPSAAPERTGPLRRRPATWPSR